MASQFDLAPRLAALKAAGLVVEGDYKGSPAKWLVTALKGRDAYVLNCKGVNADNTIVMVKLSKLEELMGVQRGE